jgi:branched-chain amino acid transport system ATP-binding protein
MTTENTAEVPGSTTSGVAGGPVQDRLSCSGVTVRFGGLVAVNNAGLAVQPGKIVGLVGPNGAGKSTLFGVLSGLIKPSQGTVLLDGKDITHARPQLRAAGGLARTFQHPELFTGLTVREHLVLAYRAKHAKGRVLSDLFTLGALRRASRAENNNVDELLEFVGLADAADRSALGLPLGMARLVELGRALAASPTVLLLDEPSSGLDTAETDAFEAVLQRIAADRGISILLVEHDVELVMRLSSTVNVLDFGSMIATGTPEAIQANPAVRAAYLGEEVASKDAEAAAEPEVSRIDLVAVTEAAAGVPTESASGPLLIADKLCVHYGDALALEDVSFSLGAGKVLAVLGANGAGKSTLARATSGLVGCHSGTLTFAGENISSWAPHRIRRAGLVHLPEGRGIFRALTVMDNVRMASATMGSRKARNDSVNLAMEIFPVLGERRNQVAGLLSGGEQQMLSLARALASSPQLIIADEMSLGLAPKMVDLVFDGLGRAREAGVTVIMIEQYVHRALAFADECLVLQRGSIAWQGPANEAGNEVLRHYIGDAMTAEAS